MSDFILLLNPSQCPSCRCNSVPANFSGGARCRSCGMMLFQSGNDLAKYEADTGWREYWVWTGKAKGWIHRSHLFSVDDSKPLEILSPLSRNVPIPALDSDYGTPGYAKRQLENSPERQELKREYKRLKKKPMTVRKIY